MVCFFVFFDQASHVFCETNMASSMQRHAPRRIHVYETLAIFKHVLAECREESTRDNDGGEFKRGWCERLLQSVRWLGGDRGVRWCVRGSALTWTAFEQVQFSIVNLWRLQQSGDISELADADANP